MNELKLKEISGMKRFPTSRFKCPKCGERAREDNWPPNQGMGCFGDNGGQYNSTIKHICVKCKIAFMVFCEMVYGKEGQVREEISYSDETPNLIEQDGFLLTPYDVWVEQYKKEHGQYPVVAYA